MAKKREVTPARAAVELALSGDAGRALQALVSMSNDGDACAAASAAELLAFNGQWRECVEHARRLLAEPDAVQTGNVFTDLCRLVRRAARELGDRSIIDESAKVVPEPMRAQRDAVLLDEYVEPSSTRAPNRAKYDEAVVAATKDKRFKGKPTQLDAHCFALAVTFAVDDLVIARFDESNPMFHFDHAVSAARALVKQGQSERAWKILRSFVPRWWPVDQAQVAPVILLVDPWIAPIVTADRAREVLTIPRGKR